MHYVRRPNGRAGHLADIVMSEEADVCENTQRGLRALPHARGVLMPEEHVVRPFHQWIQSELQRN